jgi:hypothetical protein
MLTINYLAGRLAVEIIELCPQSRVDLTQVWVENYMIQLFGLTELLHSCPKNQYLAISTGEKQSM